MLFVPRPTYGFTHSAYVLLAVAIAVSMGTAAPTDAAVFGSDDRAELTSDPQNLKRKIGTLSSSKTGAFCTAFCVAPDVIATASHCLYGTAESAQSSLRGLTFKTADQKSQAGTRLAASSSSAPIVMAGTTRLAVTPPIGAVNDWAIVRLEAPVCGANVLSFSAMPRSQIDAAAARGNIYQVAAHADLPDMNLRRGGPCAVQWSFPSVDTETIARDFAAPQAILFHTCDTGGGSSGSPMLIDTLRGPEVVGINVGTYILSRAVTTAGTNDTQSTSVPIANTAISVAPAALALARLSGAAAPLTLPKFYIETVRTLKRGPTRRAVSRQEWPSASLSRQR